MGSNKQIRVKNIKRLLKSCLQPSKENSDTEEKLVCAKFHLVEVLKQFVIFSSEKGDSVVDLRGFVLMWPQVQNARIRFVNEHGIFVLMSSCQEQEFGFCPARKQETTQTKTQSRSFYCRYTHQWSPHRE